MENLKKPFTRKNTKSLPASTGIYIFKKGREIIYVGKSVNIRARVVSHIENAKLDFKEKKIITEADNLSYILCDSEFKALILESKQIRMHLPKYNARSRDDKSYLYIKITIADEYPKIYLSRLENDGKSRYFGPFPSVKTAELILRLTRKIFPFCSQKKISKRPCFYSKLGLCQYCPNETSKIVDKIEKRKRKKIYRKNIFRAIALMDGKMEAIVRSLHAEMAKYSYTQNFEKALLCRNQINKIQSLMENSSFDFRENDFNNSDQALVELNVLLKTSFGDKKYTRIECVDISNLSMKEATASRVVFINGLSDKSKYRRYKIKKEKVLSDFDAMYEVLTRRFKNDPVKPDILVVDGGRPQVRVAQKVLLETGISDLPILGIAKNPDRLVIGRDDLVTIRPSLHNPGFNLIRAIRDEAHRFAKKYHLFLRTRKYK